ncbi:unnamed protein product [Effrenium voratum]|uniref:Transposase n=1 Tax=Effrenium voratum TaxID=2562239 RepID=A0AA36HYD4_9DINO|nr:unnamed protein product [Effrenium voratum]
MRGRQNAKTLEYWPFTLKSFVDWFFDGVLVTMLPSILQHGITWIGRTRTGKSLGSKTILFAQSKFEIDRDEREDLVPSIVTAKHLDFFKAEPITKYKPGVFDDGMLQKMDASFLKAFLNPSEEDATVWARYSSAQFDQGAGRQACNNPYDKAVDDKVYADMKAKKMWTIPHSDFMNLIQPSFSGVDDMEDMNAILARTHIIVITDLLAPSQKPIFEAYKRDPHKHTLPPNFIEDSIWSQTLLKKLFNGETIPSDIGSDNGFPAVGETEDLEQELAHILDNMDDFPDNTEIQPSDEPSHFTGIKLVEGFVIEYDNDVLTHLSMGGLYDYLQQEGRTIFALQKVNHDDLITSPTLTQQVVKEISPTSLHFPQLRTSYGHNYKWENGKKINTIGIQQLGNSVLFVNSKKAFTLNFLKCHEELMFCGHVSALAVEHAYFATHSPHMSSENDIIVDFRKLYHTGLFYYLALKEFQPLDRHLSIVIDDEVPDNTIELYDAYCHGTLFPPMNKQKVKIVVGDGNMRLNMLCQEGPKRRTGRPRAGRASVGKHANGWFMVCDPSTGKILGLRVMKEPENTQHVLQMLDAVVWLYPKLNTFVYDRACSIVRAAHEEDSLGQIEHYIVDWFHAYRHNSKCKCNPRKVRKLGKIVKNVNTSICEQIFSWFRHYSTAFNELRTNRHKFVMLYMAKRHNLAVEANQAQYLRPDPRKSLASKSCTCGSKKAMKGRKLMKAMRVMKAMKK